jgi:fructosamine-3-kinase
MTLRCYRAAADAIAGWFQNDMNDRVVAQRFISGSGWSSAYRYETASGTQYFVKLAVGRDVSMFEGEALGLRAMRATKTIRIPEIVHYGPLPGPPGGGALRGGGSFIVMESLEMGAGSDQAELGRQLGKMHLAEPMASSFLLLTFFITFIGMMYSSLHASSFRRYSSFIQSA